MSVQAHTLYYCWNRDGSFD